MCDDVNNQELLDELEEKIKTLTLENIRVLIRIAEELLKSQSDCTVGGDYGE